MNEITKTPEAHVAQIDPMISMIEKVLLSPDLPLERLSAVMDMQERQLNKQAEQAFNASFCAAMAEMTVIPKSGKNTHNGVKYSTVDDIINTTRPVLSRHGLALNWEPVKGTEKGIIGVAAIVRHVLGHSIRSEKFGAADSGKQMNALQGAGSTDTYLRRYTALPLLGLSTGEEVENDGAGETITADQFQQLAKLIEETNTAEDKFKLALGFNNDLHMLPLSKFGIAIAKLQKKKATIEAAQ